MEELSRFQRVSFVEKVDASRCPERRPQCLVRAYTGLADVLVLGRLADERLHYEAYETWTRTSAFRGSLGLGAGVTSGRLQHLMGDIVRPIVQSGGLLDRKPPPAQPAPSEPQRTAARPARARVLSLAIGLGAAFFLALPILIALLLVRPARISEAAPAGLVGLLGAAARGPEPAGRGPCAGPRAPRDPPAPQRAPPAARASRRRPPRPPGWRSPLGWVRAGHARPVAAALFTALVASATTPSGRSSAPGCWWR